jgi:hypothetical protein
LPFLLTEGLTGHFLDMEASMSPTEIAQRLLQLQTQFLAEHARFGEAQDTFLAAFQDMKDELDALLPHGLNPARDAFIDLRGRIERSGGRTPDEVINAVARLVMSLTSTRSNWE